MNFKNIRLKAFSLLEITIVLSIMGVLMLSISKGFKLLRTAKIEKFTSQIESINLAIDNFKNRNGRLPGINNNNKEIESNELFWQELENDGLLTAQDKTPSIGGSFKISKNGIIFQNQNNILSESELKYVIQRVNNIQRIPSELKLTNEGILVAIF